MNVVELPGPLSVIVGFDGLFEPANENLRGEGLIGVVVIQVRTKRFCRFPVEVGSTGGAFG